MAQNRQLGDFGQYLTVNSSINTVALSSSLSVGGDYISPVQSFRNKIINGGFDIWQRGTSVSGIASGQYLADRWYTGRSGTTVDVSRQTFTLGQTDVPGQPTYFHRSVVTSASTSSSLAITIQPIEYVKTLSGQTATLSFWAKADASKNLAVEFQQTFGSGGSPSSDVNFNPTPTTCALTTSWQKFVIPISIPSISGKTLGTSSNDKLFLLFWLDAGSNFNSRTNSLGNQSGTFDIAQVQLEAGSVATPFEQRPIGTELALCQRYYQRWEGDSSAIGFRSIGIGQIAATVTDANIVIPLSVPMRAIPTLSFSGTISIIDGVLIGSVSSIESTFSSSSSTMWGIFRTGSTLTSGRGAIMYTQNANTNWFAASAEL